MSLSPRLVAAAVIASLALTAPVAFACGSYERAQTPERVTGHVVNVGAHDITLTYRGATVLVQYPHFQRSGNILYQQAFTVATDYRFWGLYRALRDRKGASARVELEQVGNAWHLVSWSRA